MKKILLTGQSGFIGKNILPGLQEKYEIDAPNRQQLDLKDTDAVYKYVKNGNFDVMFHLANPNPTKNSADNLNAMFEDSMKIFMNFYRVADLCEKLIYLGSGAEYDKRRDLCSIKEEQIGESIPSDTYGFSKYIMNQLAAKTDNIYNMRLFACYGSYDHESKFITHSINCCLKQQPVTIRQNCWFDYMHVEDFLKISCWFIDNTPKYHDYNICSGKRITLENIAKKVCEQMDNNAGVQILKEGYNKEYTADNSRLMNEMSRLEFVPIDMGISKQIEWQRRNIE